MEKAPLLALKELKAIGANRCLLTVNSDNYASIRVIEADRGRCENELVDPQSGTSVKRYWIHV